MLRVLFILPIAAVGGHLRSALTLAKALRDVDVDPHIAAGAGPAWNLLEATTLKYYPLHSVENGSNHLSWKAYPLLRDIIRRYRIHILQCYGFSLVKAHLLSQSCGVPYMATISGGPSPRFYPQLSPIVVFSEELRNALYEKGHRKNALHVMPARIDITRNMDISNLTELANEINIPLNNPIVMLICRTDTSKKLNIIRLFFQAAKLFNSRFVDTRVRFLHIGTGRIPGNNQLLQNEAARINRQLGEQLLHTTQAGSSKANRFLSLASIVIGVGRSAFEGMALSKPTLIVGENGFAGIVQPETIQCLSYYNFSGRNVTAQNPGISLPQFVESLSYLLENPWVATEIGRFGFHWLERNLDVRLAAAYYKDLYINILAGNWHAARRSDILKQLIYETLRTVYYSLKPH